MSRQGTPSQPCQLCDCRPPSGPAGSGSCGHDGFGRTRCPDHLQVGDTARVFGQSSERYLPMVMIRCQSRGSNLDARRRLANQNTGIIAALRGKPPCCGIICPRVNLVILPHLLSLSQWPRLRSSLHCIIEHLTHRVRSVLCACKVVLALQNAIHHPPARRRHTHQG